MEPLLTLSALSKHYEKVTALNKVDLVVNKGSIFGLLGPNGAGKTSMIRIITRITMPDSGDISYNFDRKTSDEMERIGYLPEERGLYPDMKIREQLLFFAQIKGMNTRDANKNIDQWFDTFKIHDWANKKAQELSKGMQQLVQFISCMLHDPEIIILDEPFTGLDPINSNLIKNEIYNLKQKGKSIIFSTHRMEQVEEICDEIALINKGEIILRGSVKEIKDRFKKGIFELKYIGEFPEGQLKGFEVISHEKGHAVIKCKEKCSYSSLLRNLSDYVEIYSFSEILPSLNEIFIDQVSQARQRTAEGVQE